MPFSVNLQKTFSTSLFSSLNVYFSMYTSTCLPHTYFCIALQHHRNISRHFFPLHNNQSPVHSLRCMYVHLYLYIWGCTTCNWVNHFIHANECMYTYIYGESLQICARWTWIHFGKNYFIHMHLNKLYRRAFAHTTNTQIYVSNHETILLLFSSLFTSSSRDAMKPSLIMIRYHLQKFFMLCCFFFFLLYKLQ